MFKPQINYGRDVKTGEIKPVLSGAECFRLCDTSGMPFDELQELLREKNLAFNWPEFIEAAAKAGWPPQKCVGLLVSEGKTFEEYPMLFWAVPITYKKVFDKRDQLLPKDGDVSNSAQI